MNSCRVDYARHLFHIKLVYAESSLFKCLLVSLAGADLKAVCVVNPFDILDQHPTTAVAMTRSRFTAKYLKWKTNQFTGFLLIRCRMRFLVWTWIRKRKKHQQRFQPLKYFFKFLCLHYEKNNILSLFYDCGREFSIALTQANVDFFFKSLLAVSAAEEKHMSKPNKS